MSIDIEEGYEQMLRRVEPLQEHIEQVFDDLQHGRIAPSEAKRLNTITRSIIRNEKQNLRSLRLRL
jgi:hypothetical protein